MSTKKNETVEIPKFKPFRPTGALTDGDCQIIVFALGCLVGSLELDENRRLSATAKCALEVSRKFGVTL